MTPTNPVVGRPGGILDFVTVGAPPCARSSAATHPAKSTASLNSGRASGMPGLFLGCFAKGGGVEITDTRSRTGTDLKASPSPMGSRSWDVIKNRLWGRRSSDRPALRKAGEG